MPTTDARAKRRPRSATSFRPNYGQHPQGQRTGTKTVHTAFTVGWQHWFSPQFELRPEIGVWAPARNGFDGSPGRGVASDKNHMFIGGADLIEHSCA